MAVCEMRKVYIIGEESLRDSLIKRLGDLGLLQPKEVGKDLIPFFFKKNEVKAEGIKDNLSQLDWTIEYLEQFEEKELELGLFPSKTIIRQEDYLAWIENFDWEKIYQRCRELKEKVATLKEERKALLEDLNFLRPWRKLNISREDLPEGRYVFSQLGKVALGAKETFIKEVEALKGTYLHVLTEETRNVYFLLISLKENQGKIESIFQSLKVERVQFEKPGIPRQRFKDTARRIAQIDKQMKEIEREHHQLSEEKVKLMALYDHYQNLLQEKKVAAYACSSSYTFVLEGWIREVDLPRLKEGLKDYSLVQVVARKPGQEEEDEVPIALSNKRIFKPFELVTNLYGLPRYFEVDPTPFLAPFFALFLAFCLTDGGYGIILSLLAYFLPRKLRLGEGGKKLFSLLFISGLVTIGVGTISGGLFGIELTQLPPFLAPLKHLALFNPLKNPMLFFLIVLGAGIVHLLMGIGVELWDDLRRKDISSALLDHASWIVLILGAVLLFQPAIKGIFFADTGTSGVSSQLGLVMSFSFKEFWTTLSLYSKLGLVMFLGGGLTLLFFVGRESKNLVIRLGKGAYELYGLIQIFGDILSYSRLLALGLATSVIATVVNTVAQMFSTTPFIGPILMILVLIVGHLGNIVINCLSGFIHTARLQFVEFFTKFYQGGGKDFKPFKQEGRYLAIK